MEVSVSPLPSKVLQSFINSVSDETDPQEVFSISSDTKPSVNALVTLPRGLQASSSLSSFQDSISEESGSPSKKLPSGICSLYRKAPVRRISTGEHYAKYDRKNHELTKSSSAATMDNTLSPYNPNEPLSKLPIKQQKSTDHLQSGDSYFTRTKSINATIGPLTKEVCGKLNISWENIDPCVSPQDAQVCDCFDSSYMVDIITTLYSCIS